MSARDCIVIGKKEFRLDFFSVPKLLNPKYVQV